MTRLIPDTISAEDSETPHSVELWGPDGERDTGAIGTASCTPGEGRAV